MDEIELKKTEEEIREAIYKILSAHAPKDPINKIAPTTSILIAAAASATNVIIAFERGYQLGDNNALDL